MKVLISEDDFTSRIILTAVTKKWGYEPVEAEDGEIAWETLQEKDPPRLMLIDWEMPNLNGLDLCRKIRQVETQDPPFIILLTANSETGDIVKGLESGSNDYVVKSFQNAELQARLQVGMRMLDLQTRLKRANEILSY